MKRYFSIPDPFGLAIGLSILSWFLAYFFGSHEEDTHGVPQIFTAWQAGFWDLLAFSMQMILILVLGHCLALTNLVSSLIESIARSSVNSRHTAVLISIFAIFTSLINWGLALIFSAILARKIAEKQSENGNQFNYALYCAAAYSTMLVWHGGLSGSAPLKVAEKGHFLEEQIGIIPLTETLFSSMNLLVIVGSFIIIPVYFASCSYFHKGEEVALDLHSTQNKKEEKKKDAAFPIGWLLFPFFIFGVGIRIHLDGWGAIDLNLVNFTLFGLCLGLHKTLGAFTAATKQAIAGGTGILLQFPLYAGIMGVLTDFELINIFSESLMEVSKSELMPQLTLLLAGIINIFVPSGGGQWVMQGPILAEMAANNDIAVNRLILALAYGDQLTNMIQPFWALPLLAITGIQAKKLLKYTVPLMIIMAIFYSIVLWVF
ncbi:MAG: TIGR00366 family protein [Cyclobacteriaceae bacterium]|nr:short-chain fatty acid transporter [Cyclobacteriaceae bacterium]MCH8517089.1 TIGR00366 family protein [Cyclobacteriaceae bacterium]